MFRLIVDSNPALDPLSAIPDTVPLEVRAEINASLAAMPVKTVADLYARFHADHVRTQAAMA